MRRIATAIALSLAATASLAPAAARGQCLAVEYDLNVPAYEGAVDADHEQYATSRGTALGVSWLSRAHEVGVRRFRWQVRVGYQAHAMESRGSTASVTRVSATTFEMGPDYYLTHIGPVMLSAGAAAGFVIVGSENESFDSYCDSPFCNWPEGGWQASGFGRLELPVSPSALVSLGIRGRLVGPGRAEIFPIAPGPVFTVGVQLRGSRKEP